jgi:hypothetical protein
MSKQKARAKRVSGKARDKKYGYESILLRVRPEVMWWFAAIYLLTHLLTR